MSTEAAELEDYSVEKPLAVCDESIDCSDSPVDCKSCRGVRVCAGALAPVHSGLCISLLF